MSWLEEAVRVPIPDAIGALGLQVIKKRSFGPCPGCGEQKRGSSDRRGPLGADAAWLGWACMRCGIKGDVVDLVSHVKEGARFRELDRDSKRRIREWFSGASVKPAPASKGPRRARGPKRPPADEVSDLWAACLPMNRFARPRDGNICQLDHDTNDWLAGRRYDRDVLSRLDVARITPLPWTMDWPAWWPKGRAKLWRLVVPAFEPDGTMASLHGRRVRDDIEMPKTLWAKDAEAKGLIMADPVARAMIRREQSPAQLWICEGITDYLRTVQTAAIMDDDIAVISATSGGFTSVGELPIPSHTTVFVATDADGAGGQGDRYAQIVARALHPRPVYRIPLA